MDISENEDKFIYKKVDFLKIGVKEGSFNKLITDLGLDSSEYCCYKTLPEDNNRKTRYFTASAYEKVLKSVKDKKQTKNNVELTLFQANQNLKQQLMEVTTKATVLENSFLKEREGLKDELSKTKIEYEGLKQINKFNEEAKMNLIEMYNKTSNEKQHNIDVVDHLRFKDRLKFLFTGKINYNVEIKYRKSEIKQMEENIKSANRTIFDNEQ